MDMIIKRGAPVQDYKGKRWIITGVKNKSAAINHFKAKIRIDDQFKNAPDGVYTWTIVDGHLLTLPVLNAQEVGALHINMLMWVPPEINTDGDIIAGELRKNDSIVNYNLKSGTFMEEKLKGKDERYIQAVVDNVTAKFESVDIIAHFLHCRPCTHEYETLSGESIIDTEGIRTSDEEMDVLKTNFILEPAAGGNTDFSNLFGGVRRSRRKHRGWRRRARAKNLTRRKANKQQVRQTK